MKTGDKIKVISGQLKGATGTIENTSKTVPGGFLCRLDSLKPAQIKILTPGQILLV